MPGFWQRLFGTSTNPPPPPAPTRQEVDACMLNEGRGLAVVGESHYQPAIRAAVGAYRGPADQPRRFLAALMLEPDNPYDPLAVAVHLSGYGKVGHLSRDDARAYHDVLRTLAGRGQIGACYARVYGGVPGKPSFGVWLDVAKPGKALDSD